MTRTVATRRTQRRYPVPAAEDVFVEFSYPNPNGERIRLPMVDLSVAGLSFDFDDELPGIEPGVELVGVAVGLGGCVIQGDLVVFHVTPRPGQRTVCGALFYPSSDAELTKLKSAVAGIKAVYQD
jgi:hypothetical protein